MADFQKIILGVADYSILALILIASSCIGLYFKYTGGRQRTNEEYLMAGRDMSILPVSLSLMATFLSATTLMGIPAEMYLFGTHMAFMNVGFLIGPIIVAWLFLPVYFDVQICTSYEYLEKRFGKTIRKLLSAGFILQSILFTAVSLYAPSIALSAVTNIPLWLAIASVGTVCTFYCTLGGMKAVLWTDAFQTILMFCCPLAIIIKGSIDLGFLNIFETAKEGGRLVIPSLDMNFSERYTLLSVILQGIIITLGAYGCSQCQVQRLLTIKDLKRSKIAAIASIPMVSIFQLACCLCGLIFYAYYKKCDPLSEPRKPIQSADQLMPLYVVTVLQNYPGLPGLCIGGIFSASLSTVSSAVNAMAAVTLEDFVRPMRPDLAKSVFVSKALTVAYGVLSVILSFLGGALGNLVKASVMVVGVISGPTLGIFLLALFTTTSNEKGSGIGFVGGIVLSAYLSVAATPKAHEILPLSNECPNFRNQSLNLEAVQEFLPGINQTWREEYFINSTITLLPVNESATGTGLQLSYMWISSIGLVTCVIVGFVSSIIFGYFEDKPQPVPLIYLSPVKRWLCTPKKTKESESELKAANKNDAPRQLMELRGVNCRAANPLQES